tara:strand:+ start:593 stop:865 length:273 start_codon:yes stop_codon:yes gene_type:complete
MKPLEFDPGKYIGVKNQIVRDENNNLFVVDRNRGFLLELIAINSDGFWRGHPAIDRFLTVNIDPYSRDYKKIYPHKINGHELHHELINAK